MDIEVVIDDEEDILRVYSRPDTDTWGLSDLRQSDFARLMAKHSGISMWRMKFCGDNPHQYAMDSVPVNPEKRKGTAVCKAKLLKELGLRFFAHSANHAHISARCAGCNFHVDYETGLCKRSDGKACGFDIKSSQFSISKTLSNKKFFNVSYAIYNAP